MFHIRYKTLNFAAKPQHIKSSSSVANLYAWNEDIIHAFVTDSQNSGKGLCIFDLL